MRHLFASTVSLRTGEQLIFQSPHHHRTSNERALDGSGKSNYCWTQYAWPVIHPQRSLLATTGNIASSLPKPRRNVEKAVKTRRKQFANAFPILEILTYAPHFYT